MLLAALLLLAEAPAPVSHSPTLDAQKIVPMDDQRFWSIIERSALKTTRPEQQEVNLRGILAPLPIADLIAWQAAYDAKRAAAYSWDLWGAAYVIHGGASDDGFDYFRSWLISCGPRIYTAALADPDSLADAVPADAREPAQFEGFGHVAMALWANRTGRNPAEMPNATAHPANPTGKPWSEDPAALAARYPKLWKRFGSAPLG